MNFASRQKLESRKPLGPDNPGHVHRDWPTPVRYGEVIWRYEGTPSHLGPRVAHANRLPKNKFFVREPDSKDVVWWDKVNRFSEPAKFEGLKQHLCAGLPGQDIFMENCCAGANERHRVPVRIIVERAAVLESNFSENSTDTPDEVRCAGPVSSSMTARASN